MPFPLQTALMVWLALTCPLLLFALLLSDLIGFSESEATWNSLCPKQKCWFIREAGRLSSCGHGWCRKPLQQCPTLFLLIIDFPGGNTYNFFTPTKWSEQCLVAADWSRALEAIFSGIASFYCPASDDSAFPKHIPHPPPPPPPPNPHCKNLPFKVFPNKQQASLLTMSAHMVFDLGKRMRSRVEASLSGMSESPWKSPN